jgi:predicted permease
VFRRREVERDLDDELEFHLAMQAATNRQAGMAESEARLAARRQFGGVTQQREACRGHIFGWMEGFGQDLRHAARALRRSPGFSAFVVLTLAFGIGTNVTVFSIVNAVLLESPPFRDADRLVTIPGAYSVPAYEFYARSSTVFSGVAAWVDESMTLVVSGSADRVRGARASASFFPVLGVQPLLGRSFQSEEDRPGGAHVAMLSYDAWRNRFGGDRWIIGKAIRVNAESLTVVGVLPPSFWFAGEPVEVWVPRVFDNRFVPPQMIRDGSGILTDIVARLRPGVSLEQADAALRVMNARLDPRLNAHLQPIERNATADIRPSLLLLWGAAGCILLVTCANTSSLLVARATARRKEIAVRLALGVSRSRLARQLMAESVPYAAAGGVLGFLLARVGLAAITALTGQSLTGWRPVQMGNPVIAFAIGASFVSALVFGLAPVLQSLRCDLQDGLKDCARGDSSAGQPRLRGALVITETAVAVVLAMSAALLTQSYVHMRTLRTGVQSNGLVTALLHLPDARYGAARDRVRFYDEFLRRVREIPGVQSVGATSALQLQSKGEGSMTWPEGAVVRATTPLIVRNRSISPDYFRVLGIPLVAGRQFTEADDASSPNVMLVNQSFARNHFPDGRAIGRRVTYSSLHVTCQIVGVVADVRPRMTDAAAQPEMYFPYMQRSRHEMSLVVRSRLTPGVLERAIRGELRAVDPEQPLYAVQTMEEVMDGVLSRPRSTTSIVAFFSVAALLLAAIGIYGVLSFSVAQRSREIGIRMALGAQVPQIRALVVRQSLKLVAAGIAVGIPAALLLARFSSTLLFGIAPAAPATIGAVVTIVLSVGWIAAYLPARHATRIDPLGALRSQ